MSALEYAVELESNVSLTGFVKSGVESQNQNKVKSITSKIADAYFAPNFFEKNGTIYEYLGVKQFKKALMGTLRKLSDGSPSTSATGRQRDLEALTIFEQRTRFNETIHAPQIIFNAYCLFESLSKENYGYAAIWSVILGINVYSTMLQRYNRAKLWPIIEHKKAE